MSDDAKALQEFGSSSHPGTIADFPGTLFQARHETSLLFSNIDSALKSLAT